MKETNQLFCPAQALVFAKTDVYIHESLMFIIWAFSRQGGCWAWHRKAQLTQYTTQYT